MKSKYFEFTIGNRNSDVKMKFIINYVVNSVKSSTFDHQSSSSQHAQYMYADRRHEADAVLMNLKAHSCQDGVQVSLVSRLSK